jgi:ammonia channel protein AmtB
VAGFLSIQKRVPRGAPLRNWWLAFSVLSVLCWTFSTVFHARDTYLTERLDYAGGMVVNVAALAGLALRLIGPERMTG